MWRNTEVGKDKFLPLLQPGKYIAVFDTETTGLGKTAKIIQFSAVRYQIGADGMQETGSLDLLINPEEPLSERIIELTGITDALLTNEKTEREQFEKIKKFMESVELWAAYNCNFDLRMINQMEERIGKRIATRDCVDVYEMARDLISADQIENYKLATVFEHFYPDRSVQYHTAMEDTRATGLLLETFRNMYQQYEDPMKGRLQSRLEYASYWQNPKQPSQKRIKIKLSSGEYGDIFWDVIKKSWGCKSSSKARKLFDALDLKNIEQQVMNRYAWRYHAESMDALASEWAKAKKKQASS